ncbi:hypothetical protein M569_14718, partial [Genlisea aurea]
EEGAFRLFDDNPTVGSSCLEKTHPPPHCSEISVSEVSRDVNYTLEPVDVGGLTLLKGRVNTRDVFALSNSDLVPGKYEGGLKLWECSLDLIAALNSEIHEGILSFTGKRVLELGCGHGLPGIFACLKGSAAVHFQDFNAEVLRCLTIRNVTHNVETNSQRSASSNRDLETRFFSGDWGDIDRILFPANSNESDGRYDIILMSETVYSISSLPNLFKLIKKRLRKSGGVVYMAAKKYYFGVGGGTRQFISMVEEDGDFCCSLIAEITSGSSNIREVWKVRHK